jgi:hypothetical protein
MHHGTITFMILNTNEALWPMKQLEALEVA